MQPIPVAIAQDQRGVTWGNGGEAATSRHAMAEIQTGQRVQK